MAFGEQLQRMRRENGMTQEEFAAQMKVSRQAVSKWESGKGYPEIEKILYICNRYGVTMNELFAEEAPIPGDTKQAAVPETFQDRPLKRDMTEFYTNLSPAKKRIIQGVLAALVILVLLMLYHAKGGSDRVMTLVWTAAIILFGVVEAVTAGLVCIWFAVGALAALIAAFVDASVTVQVVLFAAVSAAALALTRPLVRKLTRGSHVPTNLDQVLGKTARVTEEINNERSRGAVYVDGKTWTARSAGGAVIPEGTQVSVLRMEGVKLMVEPINETMEVQV